MFQDPSQAPVELQKISVTSQAVASLSHISNMQNEVYLIKIIEKRKVNK